MSEIKTKIRTYNDVIDLFGEEKAADMLSEALGWSTIDPKNDKKNIMERKPLLAMDDYSGPETKEGLRGMYHSPQDVSAFSDPFCGSVSVTPTRDEKQEPAKSGLEAKRDACAISAAHLDSPNTEIPDGKNMERE